METDGRWARVRELFLEVADLREVDREARLAELEPEVADRVRELVQHDAPDPEATPPVRERIGPYRLLRRIGCGGMGEVFQARRADGEYESEVAVKLLRAGTANERVVRRFLRERQTLARLDHEYIARLLDGGKTDSGEPYLVMEYVEGDHADVFAERLELRERIELFLRIGRAVAHAHERGFVHRDLKPSNVLVRSDGTPRLLDFGIARPDTTDGAPPETIDPVTLTGQRLFTPEYASPEQWRGDDVTVRSDVFALGVLLHRFLCGCLPWSAEAGVHVLGHRICDGERIRPSRLVTGATRRRIAGDLDAIVLKCLETRPARRYASVVELCEDLERHLAGVPIRARRTGLVGRTARFIRRRPELPIGASLFLTVALTIWIAAASEQRDRQRRDTLRTAVTDRVQAAGVRWSDGDAEGAVGELEAALATLRELPGDADLEAEVLADRAVLSNKQEEWQATLEIVDRASVLLEGVDEPDARVKAKLLSCRAHALGRIAPGRESRDAAAAALAHARAHLEPGDVLRSDALLDWTDELRREGDSETALEVTRELIDGVRSRNPRDETLSRYLNDLAVALAATGRFEEAVGCYREALGILSWHRGEGHPAFAKVRLNLGTTLFRMDRLEEARQEHELSLAVGREHGLELLVAANQHFLGRIACDLGDLAAAEAAAREAIEMRSRHGLDLHADRSRCLLGIVQAKAGRADEARATLTPLLTDVQPGSFLPDMEADARHRLGVILDDAGEKDAARDHLELALEAKLARFGPDHADCRDIAARLQL